MHIYIYYIYFSVAYIRISYVFNCNNERNIFVKYKLFDREKKEIIFEAKIIGEFR